MLLNLIVIVMFAIIIQLLLTIIVPTTKARVINYKEDTLNKVIDSAEDIAKFATQDVDLLDVYGETINLESESLGTEFNINLYNTSNREVRFGFKMSDRVDIGINAHDMPVGSFFLQTEDGTFLTYPDDLDLSFNTITRDGQSNNIKIDKIENLIHITKSEATTSTDQLDILVDPGHGTNDRGSSSNDGTVTENVLNLSLAEMLVQDLEDLGYNVGITRTEDNPLPDDNDNSTTNAYIPNSRIPQSYDNKAKLYIAIHHNSCEQCGKSGFEVTSSYYSSDRLAKLLVSNLSNISSPSAKTDGLKDNGVYNRTFEEGFVQDYYYFIRETGGIAMHSTNEENLQYNQRLEGAESVLIEFGYLDNDSDLAHITDLDVMSEEAKAVADAIDSYLTPTTTSLIDLETE